MRTDFYIEPTVAYPAGLAIESKWQASTGSVDEKYPYLWLNIMERFPCPAIVVLDGGGFKSGSEQWLRGKVDGVKLLAVCRLGEFLWWANRYL